MKKWYEELFTDYAATYDREVFTQGTLQEAGFIEREIRRDRSIKILDVGCGTGRHAVELARRGYDVTGLDLSPSQLKRAREKAKAAGVKVRFLRRDARRFDFRERFGLVMMLCEGAFSLMETDAMNFRILANCAASLKRGGKLVFTALNALCPLGSLLRGNAEDLPDGGKASALDLATLRMRSAVDVTDDKGRRKTLRYDERFYMPSELSWMLETLGFRKIEVFGCTVGKFSRKVMPSPNEFELLAVAEK